MKRRVSDADGMAAIRQVHAALANDPHTEVCDRADGGVSGEADGGVNGEAPAGASTGITVGADAVAGSGTHTGASTRVCDGAGAEFHARVADIPRPVMMTAVRYALEELAALYPGRAVEVRVPPAGAVQILPGTTHRRGTPPAVIETDMASFIALAVGALSWEDALASHRVQASGERTDMSGYFPIFSKAHSM